MATDEGSLLPPGENLFLRAAKATTQAEGEAILNEGIRAAMTDSEALGRVLASLIGHGMALSAAHNALARQHADLMCRHNQLCEALQATVADPPLPSERKPN